MAMRKQRKSSPQKGQGKCPQRAPKTNYFTKLAQTPEGRALRKQWSSKPRKNPGRPKGVPDGHTKETIEPIRAKARVFAEKAVEIMSDKYEIEDEFSKEALKTAVEVMRVDGDTRSRLSAARLVLDFTKQKPVSKAEVTVGKAEAFLESLLEEDE